MSAESEARIDFGLLIRRHREQWGFNRIKFAELIGVKKEVIVRMEHGVVNPTRSELVRALKVLKLPEKEKNKAFRLLRVFSPRKQKRIKFHLYFSARVRRHS